ncbi:predicted pyridoxal phosphate-dependent enzyme [Pelotomaculum thermopropionicum SI]|uniref:Predicted pyridoxal phosphate-dependent enzyme n=1 Tax=Pelotomaculum thermopropionicum (strain DSM 13744 / JCM 10971 / SI) TaxID=370438 RepID=A5CZ08_PELTS|nr:predicted pyridoxal phosphate-dependent enzyme [Pelotomaculum thermopropionicum SI]
MRQIPVLKPAYDQEEIDAVAEVLSSGWVGLGPKTMEFEEAFADYIGCDYAIALNSGTAALHLAACALQLKADDEVIVTPITFVSTVHAIGYVGATPVFGDVEPDTLNLDVQDVEKKITAKTKAVFCVHYAGHPCDMDALHKLCDAKGIYLVEDAAHACGAEYKGVKIGSISELTCFSFHAVKNLACGEGGAITCNSDWFARYFREMRWLGITKDTFSRTVNEKVYAWQYWVDKLGFKCHMHDISAAIGLVQLRKLEKNNAKRRQIVQRYQDAFADLDWLERPVEKEYAKSSWHLYVVKVPNGQIRDRLIRHLKEHNIAPGVHYYPINLHPYYKNIKAEVPVANQIWKRIISLPLFPDLTNDDQERVIQAIYDFMP